MFHARTKSHVQVLGLFAIALSAHFTATTHAAPFVPPTLAPGSTYHLIFATSDLGQGNFALPNGTFGSIAYGNLGSIGNADFIVNTAANKLGALTMPGNYRAIISDSSQDAISLGSTFLNGGTSPIYNVLGDLVAPNYASMFQGATTALNNPIRYTEYGVSASLTAWTGTNSNGVHNGQSCGDWTGSTGPCTRGAPPATDSNWVNNGANSSFVQALRLYGISAELTVPVPEPGACALLVIGAALLGFGTRRPRS